MGPIFKLFTVAGIAATLAFAQDNSQANAQNAASNNGNSSKMGVGIRASFDYSRMYGFDEEDDLVDGNPSGIGFEVGIAGRAELVKNIYFVPELNVNYTTTSHDYANISSERTYKNVELQVPLMLRGTIKERFFANAGPQINLALYSDFDAGNSATDPLTGKTVKSPIDENVKEGAFSFGLAIGGGAYIIKGLSVDARFYMGLSELFYDLDYDSTDSDKFSLINMSGAKMMTFKIGLSYWFI